MKLSAVKNVLATLDTLQFKLPNGNFVPEHFHVTEVGLVTKNFIDCGGVIRTETVVNFQLWNANDYDHRLKPQKLTQIIALSEEKLGIGDFEVEVEYQETTIGKYDLAFDGEYFVLVNKQTACLAEDQCGIPTAKPRIKLSDLNKTTCCTPESGCC
jgi:hypothetical protein